MAIDEVALAEAVGARARADAAQEAAEDARVEFHRAVRRLHLAGTTLREIAEALGLSHQRVHQIVGEDTAALVLRRLARVTPVMVDTKEVRGA